MKVYVGRDETGVWWYVRVGSAHGQYVDRKAAKMHADEWGSFGSRATALGVAQDAAMRFGRPGIGTRVIEVDRVF